jgi:hypothetical protein
VRRIVGAAADACCCLTCPPSPAAAADEDKVSKLEAELAAIEHHTADMQRLLQD